MNGYWPIGYWPADTEPAWFTKYIKNKKAVVKIGTDWHLQIYASDGITAIVDKILKDSTGINPISDLAGGILAQELASSV